MKVVFKFAVSGLIGLACAINITAQKAPSTYSGGTIVSGPQPVFPPEASNIIYGEEVRVAVGVDKQGKVIQANVLGPMAPCSNLNKDPIVAKVKDIAEAAAKATTFAPYIKDRKPIYVTLTLTYKLPAPPARKSGDPPAGEIVRGKMLKEPDVGYSLMAKARRLTGKVELNVLISVDGKVISVGPHSGHPDLVSGTIDATCKAIFEPSTRGGHPIMTLGRLVINYVP